MRAEVRGEFLDRHVVVAGAGNMARPDRPSLAEPSPLQQATDHGRIEVRLLGRSPALRIEAVGDVLCRGVLLPQGGDPRHQSIELFQLLEAPDRPDQRMPGRDASRPVAGEIHMFGVTADQDDDPVEHEAGNGLAVVRRGRRGSPKRRNVAGEPPHCGLLVIGQSLGLALHGPPVILAELLLGREGRVPIPLEGATTSRWAGSTFS